MSSHLGKTWVTVASNYFHFYAWLFLFCDMCLKHESSQMGDRMNLVQLSLYTINMQFIIDMIKWDFGMQEGLQLVIHLPVFFWRKLSFWTILNFFRPCWTNFDHFGQVVFER